MEAATLTSKGQLVIPKAIRKALHVRSGTRFAVTLESGRIVLEPSAAKTQRLADWLPALQVRKPIKQSDLLSPVEGYSRT